MTTVDTWDPEQYRRFQAERPVTDFSCEASSLTEAGPRLSRSSMWRRVGSARAWNFRSKDDP